MLPQKTTISPHELNQELRSEYTSLQKMKTKQTFDNMKKQREQQQIEELARAERYKQENEAFRIVSKQHNDQLKQMRIKDSTTNIKNSVQLRMKSFSEAERQLNNEQFKGQQTFAQQVEKQNSQFANAKIQKSRQAQKQLASVKEKILLQKERNVIQIRKSDPDYWERTHGAQVQVLQKQLEDLQWQKRNSTAK